jgi:predicted component of type VI protein secretion system
VVDESLEVTKIRMAPKPAVKADRPAGATPMPPASAAVAPPPAPPTSFTASAPAAVVAAAAPSATEPLLAELAAGLGLPADVWAGHSPAQAAAQVAALARAGVIALRSLLEQQAQARRQIGSRAPALGAVRELNALRLAATPEAALQALLAPGTDAAVTVQRAAEELAAHQARLLSAFRSAGTRLGEEIAPASLQQALGAATPSTAQQAQLWALYTQVWQGLGLAPGQPWAQGFQEAALMHLAAAYDEAGKP